MFLMQRIQAKLSITRLSGVALICLFLASSQSFANQGLESWLPVVCKALNSVGLHDAAEEGSPSKENYEPSVFVESEFILTENVTFSELLDDVETKFYMSMQLVGLPEQYEFTCTEVRGRSEEQGYVCTNTPAQDILMINPTTNRFTRATVGAWTFFHPSDLETGASLLVEHGLCSKPQPELEALLEDAANPEQ